jgi:hypothetical protein
VLILGLTCTGMTFFLDHNDHLSSLPMSSYSDLLELTGDGRTYNVTIRVGGASWSWSSAGEGGGSGGGGGWEGDGGNGSKCHYVSWVSFRLALVG